MKPFFTADTHCGHANIIKYCNRPFKDVFDMDQEIIKRWNSVVSKNDIVYHLGDFSFRGKCADYVDKLNGRIHLIKGNHDHKIDKDRFASVRDYMEINVEGVDLVLFHYAMRVWNKMRYGAISLYGHSHGNLPGTHNSLDVGVDCWDFYPVTLEQIQERLSTFKTEKSSFDI